MFRQNSAFDSETILFVARSFGFRSASHLDNAGGKFSNRCRDHHLGGRTLEELNVLGYAHQQGTSDRSDAEVETFNGRGRFPNLTLSLCRFRNSEVNKPICVAWK